MGLIDCPRCGERISSAATVCPSCGNLSPRDADIDGEKTISARSNVNSRRSDAVDSVGESREGWWSRQPTWLLFVIAFIGGSAILIAGAFAVVIVVGSVLDGLEFPRSEGDVDTTEVSIAAPRGLLVGECLDGVELDRYLTGEEFSVMSCDAPHDLEVFFVYEFAAGPFPGDEAAIDDLKAVCLSEFEGYVGRDFDSSALDYWAIWPSQGYWESGNRTGECLVFDVDSKKLTGSAFQSGW